MRFLEKMTSFLLKFPTYNMRQSYHTYTASAGRSRSVSQATVHKEFSALSLENFKYRPRDKAALIGSIV